MNIAIGIPAYNEEENIGAIIVKLKKIANTIIICNDGSTDMTAEIAKGLGAIVISHSKNKGYGEAIKTIFLRARDEQVDMLITFDADGQHQIEDISKVTEPINSGNADVVIGSRFLDDETKIPKYRKIGIKAITQLTNITTGSKITDSQSGFRAYNKLALKRIIPTESGMGISTEILMKIQEQKLRITEVPIKISYEGNTSTHNPVSHGTSVIFSTLKFVAIKHPLTFYGIPGIILLGIGLIFTAWTIQIFSTQGEFITNIAIVGGGSLILGIILLITSSILFSVVSTINEKNKSEL
ncbi:glycosyltransferase family 2 protein [Nitrosopumilus sp.]|nr:glycosyltransferase family 2 protein [Nitrosopumilus sp.]